MFEAAVADYPPAPASLTCARFSSTSHMGSAKEGKGALWRTTEVPGGIVRSSSNTPLAQGNSSDYTEGLLWFGVCSPEQLEEAQAEYVCCVGGDCVCRTAQHRRAPLLVFTCRRRRTTPCLSRFRVCPQPPQPKRQPTGRPTKNSTPATASTSHRTLIRPELAASSTTLCLWVPSRVISELMPCTLKSTPLALALRRCSDLSSDASRAVPSRAIPTFTCSAVRALPAAGTTSMTARETCSPSTISTVEPTRASAGRAAEDEVCGDAALHRTSVSRHPGGRRAGQMRCGSSRPDAVDSTSPDARARGARA